MVRFSHRGRDTFAKSVHGLCPSGRPSVVQIRSRRICLCAAKDNFVWNKIGRAPARPAGGRATDGVDQKYPKEIRPRKTLTSRCASRPTRRSPQLAGGTQRRSGSNTRRATTPIRTAMLARHLRGSEQQLQHRCRLLPGRKEITCARSVAQMSTGHLRLPHLTAALNRTYELST
jgi:hypothetical protein